jgi:parallel beta helix pectate lyase-like protein/thrombospondin type 3 repeat protein/polymorphic membrane protein
MKHAAFFIGGLICLIGVSISCFATTYYVNPGESIQDAIDYASTGDTIMAAPGTYSGAGNRDLDFGGKAITLKSFEGPDETIIDCESSGRGFYLQSGETNAAVIDGFTVTNGYIHELSSGSGGAILCYNASPTIKNCIFSNNAALGQAESGMEPWEEYPGIGAGGAIFLAQSSAVITDCVFENNRATGISHTGSYDIYSYGRGGAICYYESAVVIADCVFENNIADFAYVGEGQGGAIYDGSNYSGPATIQNCVFYGNFAAPTLEMYGQGFGGAVYAADYGLTTIVNSTFYNNGAITEGVSVFVSTTEAPNRVSIVNSILWSESDVSPMNHIAGSGVIAGYSDVRGGYSGPNNINLDPLFVDTATYDLHLLPGSPCIDAGTLSGAPASDFEGDARPQGLSVDMGADELLFVDTDGDSLPDWWEQLYFGSPISAVSTDDSDTDSLTNLEEYYNRTHPKNDDTDGDGFIDGVEIAAGSNPLHPDNPEKTFYVDGDLGIDLYDGLARTYDGTHGPKRTIQAGIDAAQSGWDYTVQVASGTYTGTGNKNLDLKGKAITVISGPGVDLAVIDCQNSGRGFYFHTNEDTLSILDGFSIINASYTEGGIFCSYSSPAIRNCIIRQSTRGIHCEYSNPVITNCTIIDNMDGVYLSGYGSNTVITNCIIWGNDNDQLKRQSGTVQISYCDVQGGYAGTGNINADPMLGVDGRIVYDISPCIDSGTLNTDTPDYDIDGEMRPQALGIDIGADEFLDTDGDGIPDRIEIQYFGSATGANSDDDPDTDGLTNLDECHAGTLPLNPDTDGDGNSDGAEVAAGSNPLYWDNLEKTFYVDGINGNDANDGVYFPKKTIQAGIDVALSDWGYTVQVAPGTYTGYGNIYLDFEGKSLTVKSAVGPAVTIIDCENQAQALYFHTYEDATSIVDGFTIKNGRHETWGAYEEGGGAILCRYSSPAIMNCIFDSNQAIGYAYEEPPGPPGEPPIWYDGIGAGGALYLTQSSAVITGCIFKNNTAYGAINSGEGGTYAYGGAIYSNYGSPVIANCLFTENSASAQEPGEGNGGAIFAFWEGSMTIINCTFYGNRAQTSGGAIYHTYFPMEVVNCILWNNVLYDEMYPENTEPNQISTYDPSNITVSYSDIQGGFSGTGNMDADPWFVNPPFDCRLQYGSPCIDSGDLLAGYGECDLDGNSRYLDATETTGWDGTIKAHRKNIDNSMNIVWALIDIGAYEYQPTGDLYDTFTVQSRDALDTGSWQDRYTGSTGAWTDTDTAGADKRFYRVYGE